MKNSVLQKFFKNKNESLQNFLSFFFCLLALSVYKYQLKPIRYSLGFQAEMWAEGATNYFDCAHQSTSFFSCFLKTDAGYLAFLPRFYSQLIQFFQIDYGMIATAQQFLAIITIIICCASVTHKAFEKLYGPYPLRLLLAFILSTHFDYELHTFINASYYLIIPASSLLAIQVIQNKPNLISSVLTGFVAAITLLSKGIFVCLLPMTALLIGNLAFRRFWKQAILIAIPCVFASYLQLVTMIQSYTHSGVFTGNKGASLVDLLWTIVGSFVNGFIAIFYSGFMVESPKYLQIFIVVLFFFSLWKFTHVFRIQRTASRFTRLLSDFSVPLMLVGGAFAAHFISVSATAKIVSVRENAQFPISGRQWFVQAVLLLLFSWFLLKQLSSQRKWIQNLVPLLTCIIILKFGIPFRWDQNRTVNDLWDGISFSNWRAFSQHFTAVTKCAPINPYPWFYGQGCEPAFSLPSFEILRTNLRTTDNLILSLSDLPKREKMLFVGFFVENIGPKNVLNLEFIENGKVAKKIQSLIRNNGPFVFFALTEGLLYSAQKISLRREDQSVFKVALADGHTPESAALWFKSTGD